MATSKFKVGSKVRYIGSFYNHYHVPTVSIGDIQTVDNINFDNKDKISTTEGNVYFNYELELVEEEYEPCGRPLGRGVVEDLTMNQMNQFTQNWSDGDIIYFNPSTQQFSNVPFGKITSNKQTIMSKITTFAKNLVLSADEKLLRKYGLHDECGNHTDEAEDLVIAKLVKENESYLIELAKGMEAEEAKK